MTKVEAVKKLKKAISNLHVICDLVEHLGTAEEHELLAGTIDSVVDIREGLTHGT